MKKLALLLYDLIQKILNNRKIILVIWMGMALYGALQAITINQINNYIIYKHVYIHTFNSTNLYVTYPGEYTDVNLYGPFFSLIIAPFSYLPDKAGSLLWAMFNALFLLFAIIRLPISQKWKNVLLLLCSQELMITSASMQINGSVCACILLGYSYIKKGKDEWALFFIMAAAFVKIYSIVGLVFFLFSRRKLSFILWAATWCVVFFFAPLLITSRSFLLQSYFDWYEGLKIKAAKNILLDKGVWFQNISLPGMIRRIFHLPALNDLLILFPAFTAFVSQLLLPQYFKDIRYQLYILCSVLIAVVIFSTGSESSTYIIALPGMVLWYLLQPKTKWLNIFFVIAFLFTSFAYSDIFTPWARSHLFKPYSLKALFPFIIWMIILIQLHTKQFLKAVWSTTPVKLAIV